MTSTSEPAARRASVIGTGLIGGSIGLALRRRNWHVTGSDTDASRSARALELGAIDAIGEDRSAELIFVATPVSSVVEAAARALATAGPATAVTDVGGVKAPLVGALDHPSFVGGHPMAGSEQEGPEGSDPALFEGATWVLTPTGRTDPAAYTKVRGVVASLGAEVLALAPEQHDALVAVVSHVPHLAAATLMALAADGAEEHSAMLRLAAGGFRDMTRVAAGDPAIWPDVCAENSEAIVAALDRFVKALTELRSAVADGDRPLLLDVLDRARAARINLPTRRPRPADLSEIRLPVPDRPGVLAEITTLAGEMAVNIEDMEIAHSAEGDRGVLSLVVDAAVSEPLLHALTSRGYKASTRDLG